MNSLQDSLYETNLAGSRCPFHADVRTEPTLSLQDELVLPKHRSTVVQYSEVSGATELHLYYGDKEISFDEPELFPFGETLAKQGRFKAGDAIGWGRGYEWPKIRELLLQLIEEGVLARAADGGPDTVVPADAAQSSRLPPSLCPVARDWDDCEAITQEITGHPVELGYLEFIVPCFRIAHIALDADHRQVGEANVFPAALRMDVPTEWRTCNLPGTRYQHEKPMNVSAMRVMRAHWPQMMAMLLRVRENYVRRFPEVADGWTVGHLERLSAAVLAVPTYQLMRHEGGVANGDLHPALSSLFRVTDGVRMVMHQMLFVPVGEPSRSPDHAVSVDEVLDYAERNYSYHATYGVCAGPKAMVRELVQVLLEGHGNGDYTSVLPEPALQAAMNDLDAAIDYGFLGLRVYAAAFSTWPVMTRTYERIAATLDAWPSIGAPAVAGLRQSMRENGGPILSRTYLAHEDWRVSREDVYADMYRQCGRALNPAFDEPALGILLAPVWTDGHRATEAGLQDLLRRRFDLAGGVADGLVADISGQIMDFLVRIQAILRTGVAVQDEINRLLGRKQPTRALTAADINVYNLLQGDDPGRLPYLVDELERLLGIRIDVCKDRITVMAIPPA